MTEGKPEADVVFTLDRIYLKDVSFEAPNSPGSFAAPTSPQVEIQLGLSHGAVQAAQGLYEVILAVTATARDQAKTVFLVEVKQAGMFQIRGVPEDVLARALETTCGHALLPFAREVVNDLVVKGGFPQLLISPINFEGLYEQKLAHQKQQVVQ
jgi:preprotein translocase subunit SecB